MIWTKEPRHSPLEPPTSFVSEPSPGLDAVPSGAGPGTILLVDDEDMLRGTLRDIVGQLGFKVLDAEDGAQGLVLFQRHAKEIRLVILDLTMPGMGGEEVLERLRSQPGEAGRIPVLLSSGFANVNVAAILGADRFTGFLQKPYTIQQLAVKIAECLSLQNGIGTEDEGQAEGFPWAKHSEKPRAGARGLGSRGDQ